MIYPVQHSFTYIAPIHMKSGFMKLNTYTHVPPGGAIVTIMVRIPQFGTHYHTQMWSYQSIKNNTMYSKIKE